MEKLTNEPVIKIEIKKGTKRSWKFVRNLLKEAASDGNQYKVDLRKASKTNTPLEISTNCCNTVLEIKRTKDFPLKDKWCKCGKTKIIEWQTI